MADELFRYRGIDSQYERDKIEYRPDLEYEIEYQPPLREYTPSPEITYEKSFPLKEFYRRSNVLEKRITGLRDLIEERLKNDVVIVDHDVYPDAKEYEIDRITFQEYKSALNTVLSIEDITAPYEEHLRVNIYEDFHATDLDGKIEVEVYRDIIGVLDDIGAFVSFVGNASSMTYDDIKSLTTEDILTMEEERFKQWEDADRRVVKFENSIRDKLGLEEDEEIDFSTLTDEQRHTIKFEYEELEKARRDLKRFETDPFNKVRQIAKQKVESWSRHANTLEPLLFKTPYDFLQGGVKCLISNILQVNRLGISLNRKDLEETRRIITNIRNASLAIEKLSRISLIDKDNAIKAVMSKILSIIEGPVKNALNGILNSLLSLRREASRDVLDWLEEVSSMPYSECWAFDKMADTMLDAIESIDRRIILSVTDLYKMVFNHDRLLRDKIEILNEKQTSRSFAKVVIQVRKMAEIMLESLDKFDEDMVQRYVEDMVRENGWDRTYDRIKNQVVDVRG